MRRVYLLIPAAAVVVASLVVGATHRGTESNILGAATPSSLVVVPAHPLTDPPAGSLPYAARVNLNICGQRASVSIAHGKRLLVYVAGTNTRTELASGFVPQPAWPLKQSMWVEYSWNQPGSLQLRFSSRNCSVVSTVTVKVT